MDPFAKPGIHRARLRSFWRGIATALLSLFGIVLLAQAWFALHILHWREMAPPETAFMAMRLAEARRTRPEFTLRQRWVDYDRISIQLKRAIIAAEDAHFVEHEGFDWDGIQLALERNFRQGKVVAGGSTITQQLAKNLFLSDGKNYLRKGQEAVITVMLEGLLDKERILEIYLNVIEWGHGTFGAEAAANRYFGVSAAALTAEQAARLAAMAPNPRFYEKNPRAPGLARKTAIILARMRGAELP